MAIRKGVAEGDDDDEQPRTNGQQGSAAFGKPGLSGHAGGQAGQTRGADQSEPRARSLTKGRHTHKSRTEAEHCRESRQLLGVVSSTEHRAKNKCRIVWENSSSIDTRHHDATIDYCRFQTHQLIPINRPLSVICVSPASINPSSPLLS